MAFIPDDELQEWASPAELDVILGKTARLEARLGSKTSPLVYLAAGAVLGIVYWTFRQKKPTAGVTTIVEDLLI
jgi:hypothetical protein